MTLYVNEGEAVWFVVTLATFVMTLLSLWDAWVTLGVVKRLNGHAREIAANSNFRREAIRLVTQTLLLFVVIPSLFVDRPIQLNPQIIALTLVPVALFANSALDTLDRRRLIGTVEKAMIAENTKTLGRIEVAITANTELTQVAAEHADSAYREANSVNEKIASQGEILIAHGEALTQDLALNQDTNDTTHRIDDRVP